MSDSLSRGVLPVFNPDPTEIINLGHGRQITINQINMYMPSTATPKPYPTSVQRAVRAQNLDNF